MLREDLLYAVCLQCYLHAASTIEQHQFVSDIERLTSDKADLLTRLQCCEEDLKTANECESHNHEH